MIPVASQRCGHAVLIGRPNVGKSTLINRLVGSHLAIVTHKPQTTRQPIVGIHTEARGQIVWMDTPGLHRRRDHALNRRLNRIAARARLSAEVLIVVLDASHQTDEDELVLSQVRQFDGPAIAVFNKIDRLADRELLFELTEQVSASVRLDAVIYVSALKNDGLDRLVDAVFEHLPSGLPIYPPEQYTVCTERFLVAELIREQLLLHLHQEIPYGLAVLIERFERKTQGVWIDALVVVAEDRHKGMVIGRRGQVLKRVGTRARHAIGELLSEPAHLRLHVRSRSGWIDDDDRLDEFGFVV